LNSGIRRASFFGEGQIAALPNLNPAGARVLLLYGGSIKRNGVYSQILAALEGYKLTEFGISARSA
jgi:NADP-dependent alcohol dehydrogenase